MSSTFDVCDDASALFSRRGLLFALARGGIAVPRPPVLPGPIVPRQLEAMANQLTSCPDTHGSLINSSSFASPTGDLREIACVWTGNFIDDE